MISSDGERSYRGILLIVIVGLLIGGIIGIGGFNPLSSSLGEGDQTEVGEEGPESEESIPVLASPRRGIGAIFMWGLDRGVVSTSEGKIYGKGSPAEVVDMIIEKEAAVGFVHVRSLKELFESNPDARLIPYYVLWPSDTYGIYATDGSGIEDPKDLEGKTVAVPVGVPEVEGVFGMIEKEYDVNLSTIQQVEAPSSTLSDRSEWKEDFDAAMVLGANPSGDLNKVFGYMEEIERRFGEPGLSYAFVLSDASRLESGEELMDTINESIIAGSENPGKVVSYLAKEIGVPESTFEDNFHHGLSYREGRLLTHMTESDLEGLQYRLEIYAGEDVPDLQNYMAEETN